VRLKNRKKVNTSFRATGKRIGFRREEVKKVGCDMVGS
jgi:hypothetical protein